MSRMTERRAARTFPLSEAEEREVVEAAQDVWQQIGYDCLQAVAWEKSQGRKKPVSVEAVSMSRRDVIEVVMDADRLSEEVRRDLRRQTERGEARPGLQALVAAYDELGSEFSERWQAASDRLYHLCRRAFSEARYGC